MIVPRRIMRQRRRRQAVVLAVMAGLTVGAFGGFLWTVGVL